MGNHNPTKRRRTADLYPAWVKELTKLQGEYIAAVKGKTFHSSWDDFLFCRLQATAEQRRILVEALKAILAHTNFAGCIQNGVGGVGTIAQDAIAQAEGKEPSNV